MNPQRRPGCTPWREEASIWRFASPPKRKTFQSRVGTSCGCWGGMRNRSAEGSADAQRKVCGGCWRRPWHWSSPPSPRRWGGSCILLHAGRRWRPTAGSIWAPVRFGALVEDPLRGRFASGLGGVLWGRKRPILGCVQVSPMSLSEAAGGESADGRTQPTVRSIFAPFLFWCSYRVRESASRKYQSPQDKCSE